MIRVETKYTLEDGQEHWSVSPANDTAEAAMSEILNSHAELVMANPDGMVQIVCTECQQGLIFPVKRAVSMSFRELSEEEWRTHYDKIREYL